MLKKCDLLAAAAVLSLLVWVVPVIGVPTVVPNAPLAFQQQSGAQSQQPEQNQQLASGGDQTPQAQTFTGKVVQQEGKYVLLDTSSKTAPHAYQLDDQDKAKPFDGKDVKVTGTLDVEHNIIHVSDIQPANG